MFKNKFKLEKLSENNIIVAEDLCESSVGEGLYTQEFLKGIITNKNCSFYLAQSYIGYFFSSKILAKDVKKALNFSYDFISELAQPNEWIGVFHSIGISPPYRGKHISDELATYFKEQMLEDKEINTIILLAWKQAEFIPAHNHLKRCGFHFHTYLEKPWHSISTLYCHACKKERCECDGAIYYIKK